MMHYLDDITLRERRSRAQDGMFALLVVLLAALALSTVAAALLGATPPGL